MTILYSEWMGEPSLLFCSLFLILAGLLIGLYGFIVGYASDHGKVAADAFPCVVVAIVFSIIAILALSGVGPGAKTVYYATIDDSSLSEVLEEYNIIEQKGSLFILEEKSD